MGNLSQHLMELGKRPATAMLRGAGSELWDDQGRRYLDFIQGWAVNCLGHAPEVLKRALSQQMDQLVNVGPAYFNANAVALAERLAHASGLERVFLASSGLEANEAAVKLARKWGQKHKQGAFEVITTVDSFHGRSLAMTCATGKAGWDRAFPPAVPGFSKVPFGDVSALEAGIGPDTVAVMLEPIQGEAGAVVPPAGYLREVRALCDRKGLLLIADEVQTGMARTGPMFAHAGEGIRVDIMTLGKGLGGGLPVSAMLARGEVACFDHGDHGGTFSGNALMCAGAIAVFDTLNTEFHGALRKTSSEYLENALRRLSDQASARLRGNGHLWGMVLPEARAERVRDRAFELGLLVNAARPNVLRFMPALDVSPELIGEMEQKLAEALS
ncbi:MAG: aminotransferase class III-fold pyridoxal phosphate-dependent enzyme [Myxococcales bacterium]